MFSSRCSRLNVSTLALLTLPLAFVAQAASAATDFFVNDLAAWEAEWQLRAGDVPPAQTTLFATTAANVALANQVAAPPITNLNLLVDVLDFEAQTTGLCRSFQVRMMDPPHDFTFDDEEGDGNLPNFDNALSVGDINNGENDDFEISVTAGPPLFALAFALQDDNSRSGQSLTVYGVDDTVLAVLDIATVPTVNSTIGIVSDEPIGRIFFDEDAGGDDIAIKDFRFDDPTTHDSDGDGISDCYESNPAPGSATIAAAHHGAADPLTEGWSIVAGDGGSVSTGFPADAQYPGIALREIDASGGTLRYEAAGPAPISDWSLEAHLRVLLTNQTADDNIQVEVANGSDRFRARFGTDAVGRLLVDLDGGPVVMDPVATGDTRYVRVEIVYSAAEDSADVFLEGAEVASDWTGASSGGASHVRFGDGAPTGAGFGRFEDVVFRVGAPECRDGIDNDGDGLIDAGEWDPDCGSANDPREGRFDFDADALSDGFETIHQAASPTVFDPTVADQDGNGRVDGQDDADSDGLGNAAEERAGTDPLDPDTDDDGVSDGAELTSIGFNDALAPISASADFAFDATAADLDGDGDLDVVSVAIANDEIRWYPNLGLGTFGTGQLVSNQSLDPISIESVDFDADGDLDLLTADGASNAVAWHENTAGDGSAWTRHVISLPGELSNPREAIPADLDGDGDADVVVVSLLDDEVSWYENQNGAGNFSSQKLIAVGPGGAIAVGAVDVEGDGDLDVFAALSTANGVAIFSNLDGEGSFGAAQIVPLGSIANPLDVRAADLDGDGDQDLAVAAFGSGTIAWSENLGGGLFQLGQSISSSAGETALEPADVDGDGDFDLISANLSADTVHWFENQDGAGSFASTPNEIETSSAEVNSVTAADLDGDGDLDVLTAARVANEIRWYENENVGDPLDPTAEVVFETASGSILIGDFPQTNFRGVPFTFSLVGGVAEYRFAGDLELFSFDDVAADGDAPLRLIAGNDLIVHPGAEIDFAAIGVVPGPGGGAGGAGFPGGLGRASGSSVSGPSGGSSGAGTSVSQGFAGSCSSVSQNQNGGDGGGFSGRFGNSGVQGTIGGNGAAGFGSVATASGGARGFGGSRGQPGTGGAGGSGGQRGISALPAFSGSDGTDGTNGSDGAPGTNGGDGANGANPVTLFTLSGGGGGAGGGSGGGGGAGGGGGTGGSGGGGGGGVGNFVPFLCKSGGSGGSGGRAGDGGRGGYGEHGGASGQGGGGGGAIHLSARGQLAFAGLADVRGAAGENGSPSPGSGCPGCRSNGSGGAGGSSGTEVSGAGDGADGGSGGNGGHGGFGGPGGHGGDGGAGAGGTLLLSGTFVDATTGSLMAAGGAGVGIGNGRFAIATNTPVPGTGTVVGATPETFAGPTVTNPFLKSTESTPFIRGIEGGAEAYGVLSGLSVSDPFFDPLIMAAPAGTTAIVTRLAGPLPGFAEDYTGMDWLLFFPISGAIGSPGLGIDQAGVDDAFELGLLTGGFANDPEFGGSGPVVLSTLATEAVYATLVPSAIALPLVNASGDGATVSGELGLGDVLYLPEPGMAMGVWIGGLSLLVGRARRRRALGEVRCDESRSS